MKWYALLTVVTIALDWLVIHYVHYASWTSLYHWGFWIIAWLLCLWIARTFLKSIALVVLLAVLEDAGFITVIGLQTHRWPWPQSYAWLDVYGSWAVPLGQPAWFGLPWGYFGGVLLASIILMMKERGHVPGRRITQ